MLKEIDNYKFETSPSSRVSGVIVESSKGITIIARPKTSFHKFLRKIKSVEIIR